MKYVYDAFGNISEQRYITDSRTRTQLQTAFDGTGLTVGEGMLLKESEYGDWNSWL